MESAHEVEVFLDALLTDEVGGELRLHLIGQRLDFLLVILTRLFLICHITHAPSDETDESAAPSKSFNSSDTIGSVASRSNNN